MVGVKRGMERRRGPGMSSGGSGGRLLSEWGRYNAKGDGEARPSL